MELDKFLQAQHQLMTLLETKTDVVDPLSSPLFKDVLIMMAGEVHEALAELTTDTKPWKQGIPPEDRRNRVTGEVVDVMFFLLEAFVLLGFNGQDVWDLYQAKLLRNVERLRLAKILAGLVELPGDELLPNGYHFVEVLTPAPGQLTWKRYRSVLGYVWKPVKLLYKMADNDLWAGLVMAGEAAGTHTIFGNGDIIWSIKKAE